MNLMYVILTSLAMIGMYCQTMDNGQTEGLNCSELAQEIKKDNENYVNEVLLKNFKSIINKKIIYEETINDQDGKAGKSVKKSNTPLEIAIKAGALNCIRALNQSPDLYKIVKWDLLRKLIDTNYKESESIIDFLRDEKFNFDHDHRENPLIDVANFYKDKYKDPLYFKKIITISLFSIFDFTCQELNNASYYLDLLYHQSRNSFFSEMKIYIDSKKKQKLEKEKENHQLVSDNNALKQIFSKKLIYFGLVLFLIFGSVYLKRHYPAAHIILSSISNHFF